MQQGKPHGKVFVHVSTVSVTSGDVSAVRATRHQIHTALQPATPEQATEVAARLGTLQRDLAGFVAQSQTRAGWHAMAGAVSCGLAVVAGLAVRALEGHWLVTGLDLAVFMTPAGYFFQSARKAEENARHLQALLGTVQRVAAGAKAGRQPPPEAGGDLPALLPEATFHAAHATKEQCDLRTEVLDLLNQAGAQLVHGVDADPLPGPGHLEFMGRVDPRRYRVLADGRAFYLPRILYRMLLGMAARRKLFGDALPRGEDPGSYFRIGDRRDRVHELETAFRESGLRILAEDGKGTKLRRIHCPPEGISIDPAIHLADPDILEDGEVRALLDALSRRTHSNGNPT